MSDNLIELRNVSKSYGKVRALSDVSIQFGSTDSDGAEVSACWATTAPASPP